MTAAAVVGVVSGRHLYRIVRRHTCGAGYGYACACGATSGAAELAPQAARTAADGHHPAAVELTGRGRPC